MATKTSSPDRTKVKGTVTRVMPDSRNFFIQPDDPGALRNIDVDGHRVGNDELSAVAVNAPKPKFRAWSTDLPKVGDSVELELIKEPD